MAINLEWRFGQGMSAEDLQFFRVRRFSEWTKLATPRGHKQRLIGTNGP